MAKMARVIALSPPTKPRPGGLNLNGRQHAPAAVKKG
jgi:hypothetical protein